MNGNAQPEGEFMTETHNPLVGASMWERDLYEHLSTHADTERVLLEEYTAAAKKTESKALEYLVNLLIEDEIRHHRYFEPSRSRHPQSCAATTCRSRWWTSTR